MDYKAQSQPQWNAHRSFWIKAIKDDATDQFTIRFEHEESSKILPPYDVIEFTFL